MKIPIEVELTDDEIRIIKSDLKWPLDTYSLVQKGILFEEHNSWESWYELSEIGEMIKGKLC